MSSRFAFACFLATTIFFFSSSAFAGKVELTTYYPAPMGEYKNLSTTEGANFATTSGNVGIGTTNPGAKLTVSGGMLIVENMELTFPGIEIRGNDPSNSWMQVLNVSTSDRVGMSVDNVASGVAFMGSLNNIPLALGINHREFVRIDNSSGNVGIGTSAPLASLHIKDSSTVAHSGSLVVEKTSGIALSPRILLVDTSLGTVSSAPAWAIDNFKNLFRIFSQSSLNTGGTSHFSITDSGNVGIGTETPGYTLTVNGTAYCNATAWASDLRWKENIAPLKDPLEKLLRLRGVEFDWKRKVFEGKNFPEGRQIGMIAQELEKEFPELVITDKDGYKAVAYDKLTVVLLEALKSQQKEIQGLKSELQTQIDLLKKEVAELKKR